jgi:protoheme IX farnesyltransferase
MRPVPTPPCSHGSPANSERVGAGSARHPLARARAFWELTKPGITQFVVLTTAAGYYLAAPDPLEPLRLANTLLGTALAAAGTNALNQAAEWRRDAVMRRTQRRPLPSGRLRPRAAWTFAWTISLAGIGHLARTVGVAPALLVASSLVGYLCVYTPLKRRHPAALWVGALPGALPVWVGWTAAGRPLDAGAWALLAILFLWQLPHFLALGWLHRDDYARAGFVTLPTLDPDGRRTARTAFMSAAALAATSLSPTPLGLTGYGYLAAAAALGLAFLACAAALRREPTPARARTLFLASVLYLPILLAAMTVGRAG